jgi:hypothetical protein
MLMDGAAPRFFSAGADRLGGTTPILTPITYAGPPALLTARRLLQICFVLP